MPTIPDSNIILDLINVVPRWSEWSGRWFQACGETDAMVINQIILAEAAARIEKFSDVAPMLSGIGLIYEGLPMEAAHLAGKTHYEYRKRGGSRERILPDFLIGAHAATKRYRILTRDQARYRSYFPDLEVISPDSHP